METIRTPHRQCGFFDLGIGLALMAIFGATAAGVVAYENGQTQEQVAAVTVASIDDEPYEIGCD